MRRYVVFLLLALLPLTASAQMRDTLRVLCIGNSFTYVCEAHQKLVDLAASEGHHIVMNAQYVGGFTFGRHLQRDETLNAIERPGPQDAFDAVFLQNQSQLHARYATDPDRYAYVLADAKELSGRVRQYSPQARIYLESTGPTRQATAADSGAWRPSTPTPTAGPGSLRKPAAPASPISGRPSPAPAPPPRTSNCSPMTPSTRTTTAPT